MRPATGAKRAGMLAILSSVFGAGAVLADERPLIWAVTRSGDRDFAFRSGVEFDMGLRASLGAESNVTAAGAAGSGTRVLPLRLWGDLTLVSESTRQASVGLRFNARTGAARVVMAENRSTSVSPSLDVSASRGLEASPMNIVARQNVTFTFSDIDAAILADIALDSAASHRAYVTVRKGLPLGVSLSASVGEFQSGAPAKVSARLQRRW